MPSLNTEIALIGLFLSSLLPLSTSLSCNSIEDKQNLDGENRVYKLCKLIRIFRNDVTPEVTFQGARQNKNGRLFLCMIYRIFVIVYFFV